MKPKSPALLRAEALMKKFNAPSPHHISVAAASMQSFPVGQVADCIPASGGKPIKK